MKLLLDANLSFRLIKKLSPVYPNCLHVERTGLPIPAEDAQIWAWAKANEYMIVTNDEDFYHLASAYGFPPKVVTVANGKPIYSFHRSHTHSSSV